MTENAQSDQKWPHQARPVAGSKHRENDRYADVATCVVCGREIIERISHSGGSPTWAHSRNRVPATINPTLAYVRATHVDETTDADA